jgi:selenium metabolism protein YedF
MMKMVTIDCRGLNCPQPVIQTKDALEQGYRCLEVLIDNEASRENVTRFARSRGCEVKLSELDDGCFSLVLRAPEGSGKQEEFDAASYNCELPGTTGLVYVIASASMGRGSDELGWALLQTYIQTIKDVEPLPDKILFYNGGVRLVTEESGALDALRSLQQQGVEIFACGTCLDFFKLTSAIKVGRISNMYDIMHAVNSATKVVSPSG